MPGFPTAVIFAGTNRLTPNNNLSSVTVKGLIIEAAAGAFTLGGNGISLGGDIGFNANPATLVNQGIALTAFFATAAGRAQESARRRKAGGEGGGDSCFLLDVSWRDVQNSLLFWSYS